MILQYNKFTPFNFLLLCLFLCDSLESRTSAAEIGASCRGEDNKCRLTDKDKEMYK